MCKLLLVKRLRWLLALILLCGSLGLDAQQDAMYTQYMYNTLMYNPAYAGTKDAVSLQAIYRNQWVDFDGAPKNINISAHGPIREKIGIGLTLQNDQWGVHNWNLLRGDYSYKFYVSPKTKISIGLNTSLMYLQSNFTELDSGAGDALFAQNNNKFLPNFGFGVFHYSNKHYIGFSIPQIVNNKLSALSNNARQYRHYYLTAGYVLGLGNMVKLKPAVLVKTVGSFAPVEVDLSLVGYFNDVFWAGVAYRTQDSFDMLVGVNITKSLKVGYAFDLITTKISTATTLHTHEVMLGYDINLKNQRIISPRYF